MLLTVLHRLRDHGNTVVVIEHNLDVIKTADWIIDLGPEGGAGGGEIVAEGPPDEIARSPASHTGRYLKPVVAPRGRDTKAGNGAPRSRGRKVSGDLIS
jgi:excinuclease ABC subunit A